MSKYFPKRFFKVFIYTVPKFHFSSVTITLNNLLFNLFWYRFFHHFYRQPSNRQLQISPNQRHQRAHEMVHNMSVLPTPTQLPLWRMQRVHRHNGPPLPMGLQLHRPSQLQILFPVPHHTNHPHARHPGPMHHSRAPEQWAADSHTHHNCHVPHRCHWHPHHTDWWPDRLSCCPGLAWTNY